MQLTKSKIFLIFCLAFIFGVFLGRFVGFATLAIFAMACIITGTVGWNRKSVLIWSIAGACLVLGAVRFISDYRQNDAAIYYGHTVQASGIISAEPDVREDKAYLTLSKVSINDSQALRSKILLSIPGARQFEYGQKLSFTGKISEPKDFPDFSYKNYLSRFGIDAVVYQPQFDIADGNFGNRLQLAIFHMKEKFVNTLNLILPSPQNTFLAGLLLGAKKQIPQDLLDQFNRTGTSHIVVISGYNITIIAYAIEELFAWMGLRKKISFGFSVLAIVLFVITTGASASAVRAGIMGVLLLIALNIGRVSVAANSLAFAAVVMLAVNPQILAFDVGFQLSFAALLGIIYLQPLLEPYFLWLPEFWQKYFLATIAAQIFAIPILMYNFSQLSLVALLPNLLVLPAVPLTMLSGFLAGLAGLIWLKLALPFSALAWLLSTYILKVIAFFASFRFAAVTLKINPLGLILYYLLVCGGIWYWHNHRDFTKHKFSGKI